MSEEPIKFKKNPFSSLGPVAIAVALGFLIAGPANRLLDEYQGVILKHEADQTLVRVKGNDSRRLPKIDLEPGTFVIKESGSWNPEAVPNPDGKFDKVRKEYERYVQAYEGKVVRLIEPLHAGSPYTAVVETDDGETMKTQIYGAHLAGLEVGSRIKKDPGSWEPYLVQP